MGFQIDLWKQRVLGGLLMCAATTWASSAPGVETGSVEQLPLDAFDQYPLDSAPPFPWRVMGTPSGKVHLSLLASGESPFIGNFVSGKGVVLRDESRQEGNGAGLATSFSPPPEGDLYLGFDFRLGPTPQGAEGLDLACELGDGSGHGLKLCARATGVLEAGPIQGPLTTIARLEGGNWYHVSVRFTSREKATFVVYQGTNQPGSAETEPVYLGPSAPFRHLKFVTDGGAAPIGTWSLDNILMAGKVDAPRQAWLPFRTASTADLRASPRKVFAYYYEIYPSLFDHWPQPLDEDPGLNSYTRGLFNPSRTPADRLKAGTQLLYRPLPRPKMEKGLSDRELLARSMEEEVRLGIQMGLDGFLLDFFAFPETYGSPDLMSNFNETSFALMDAAARVDPGFKIIPAIYAGPKPPGSLSGTSNLEARWTQAYAESPFTARALKHPQAFRLEDGRVLFSKWGTERYEAPWWLQAMDHLALLGIPNAYLGQFNGLTKERLAGYSAMCYAMADWGPRSPIEYRWVSNVRPLTTKVVSPIVYQDLRTRECWHVESLGSATLRKTWETAIADGSDWALITTWSDYTEQAQAPSSSIGFVPYDLNTFYIQWFKLGERPAITRDTLYYFYRRHHGDIDPGRGVSWKLKKEGPMGFDLRNEIELLAFLAEPGELQVQIDESAFSTNAPAGITSFRVPMPAGKSFTPVFSLARNGKGVLSGPGRFAVLNKIEYPNYQYHAGVVTADPSFNPVSTPKRPRP